MSSAHRLKLKQMPLDTWAIREKLCLAMSVQRSGDQNWVSVSRSIKPYGEADRPADWFSQKNCAAQYSDLLEKTETPKRKRGERVEIETPGDLIVRKLTYDRVEELKKVLNQEKMQYKKLKRDIEMIKSGQSDNRLHEIWNEIKDQKRAEEIAAQELQKHYEEREAKINARRLALKSAINPIKNRRSPANQLKLLQIPQSTIQDPVDQPDSTNSPIGEPLSVEVSEDISVSNSSSSTSNTPTVSQTINKPLKEQSPRPLHPSPTSPLLSSLLKSPAPNPPGGPGPLSPAISSLFASVSGKSPKEVCTPHVPTKPAQPSPNSKFVTPSTSPFTPGSITNTNAVMALFSGVPASTSPCEVSPKSNQTSPSAGAPTLSKLLELPPSSPGNLPPLPIIDPTPVSATSNKEIVSPTPHKKVEETSNTEPSTTHESEKAATPSVKTEINESVEKEPSPVDTKICGGEKALEQTIISNISQKPEPEKKLVSNEEKSDSNEVSVAEKETKDIKEKAISVNETEKTEEIEITKLIKEEKSPEKDKPADLIDVKKPNESVEKSKPVPEKEAEKTKKVDGRLKKNIKAEIDDKPVIPASKPERGKPGPKRGRRGRRSTRTIPVPEQLIQEDESMSQESCPGTPDNSVLESNENSNAPAETSEDEVIHSTGGKISIPSVQAASIVDSVPNSPISQSDDPDSLKDYKAWKKSIMLVWRAAANHKYANVFLHPVTDDHAPGYSSVVLRPMDLSTIKKNIENGIIKSTIEFQRDMMLMFQNAILYNSSDQYVYKMAVEMQDEVMQQVQDYVATQLMVRTTETKVLRGRASDVGKRGSVSDTSEAKENETGKKRKSMQEDGRGKKKSQS